MLHYHAILFPKPVSHYSLHGNLRLRDVFHRPLKTMENNTYDDLARGLCGQRLGAFDNEFSGEMTEWLFTEDGHDWGLDIVAINVQRGRDHDLPSYLRYK